MITRCGYTNENIKTPDLRKKKYNSPVIVYWYDTKILGLTHLVKHESINFIKHINFNHSINTNNISWLRKSPFNFIKTISRCLLLLCRMNKTWLSTTISSPRQNSSCLCKQSQTTVVLSPLGNYWSQKEKWSPFILFNTWANINSE